MPRPEWHIAFDHKDLAHLKLALLEYHEKHRMCGEQGTRVDKLVGQVQAGLDYHREAERRGS